MSHWNHRVIKHKTEYDEFCAVHECFYYHKKDKIPNSWTEDGMSCYGDTLEELKEELEWMLQACDKPVLEEFEGKLREVG